MPIGVEGFKLLAHLAHKAVPRLKASSGMATALHALYGAKLKDAEEYTERLGNSTSGDGGERYKQYLSQDLRGLVAILETLDGTLKDSTDSVDKIVELTQRCRGGVR